MTFPFPHYINELHSDLRGIKVGWYGMEENGTLSCGPFACRADCMIESESIGARIAAARVTAPGK